MSSTGFISDINEPSLKIGNWVPGRTDGHLCLVSLLLPWREDSTRPTSRLPLFSDSSVGVCTPGRGRDEETLEPFIPCLGCQVWPTTLWSGQGLPTYMPRYVLSRQALISLSTYEVRRQRKRLSSTKFADLYMSFRGALIT